MNWKRRKSGCRRNWRNGSRSSTASDRKQLSCTPVVTQGTAPPAPIAHCPDHTDAMLQRDSNKRSNMERANEKPVELTTDELNMVTGGTAPRTLPTHLP